MSEQSSTDPKTAGGGYGHAQLSHATGMLFWLTGLMPESVYALMAKGPARVDLYDALSVRRCLFYAARSHGIGPGEAKGAAEAAAARVGLEGRMEQPAVSKSMPTPVAAT